MRMLRILFVSMLVLASSLVHVDSSYSDEYSGNTFLADCETMASSADQAYCLGCIRGIREMNTLYRITGAQPFFASPQK